VKDTVSLKHIDIFKTSAPKSVADPHIPHSH